MDFSSCSLNLGGVECFSRAENLNHLERGFSPSLGKIRHLQNELYVDGDRILPFKIEKTELGECVSFNHMQIAKLLLATYKLDNSAKTRNINIAAASDGVCVTSNIYQFIVGIKIIDASSIDPLTKTLMSPQPRNVCWTALITLGRQATKMRADDINPICRW